MKSLLLKFKAMPDSAKSSLAFVFSSFVLKGISFVTTPIFTRILSQEDYGVMSVYLQWLSIIEVIALLGLTSAGVFNVGLNDYKHERNQYISSVQTLCNITTVVTFSIIFVLKSVLGDGFLLPTEYLFLMFVHFIFSPAQIFWITRQKYEYKYKLATFVVIFSSVISQALAVIAVLLMKNGDLAFTKLLSTEIGCMVFTLPLYIMIFWRGRTFFDFKRWKKILVFALPLIPHYLSQHVMSGADRIMLSELVSEAAAGVYSVVANISMVSGIVWAAINGSLIAYTFDHLEKKEYKNINSTVTMLVLGYGIVCFSVCLIAPEVLALLAPPEYYGGIYAVPPIAGMAFLSALYNVYANIEFFNKKSVYITTATVVATVVNIVLNALLIPKFSYVGASYTTLISYIVLVAMHYIGYRKSTRDKIYNSKNIFLISAVVLGACELCNLLYPLTVVRYAFIGAIAILAIIKRKFILQKIKALKA